jgi:feruloyl esterase
MRFSTWTFSAGILVVAFLGSRAAAAAPCLSLNGATFGVATVNSAIAVQPRGGLPAYCRVRATVKPTPQSDIKIEVWMPGVGTANIWGRETAPTPA